jgi:hypothetical protein
MSLLDYLNFMIFFILFFKSQPIVIAGDYVKFILFSIILGATTWLHAYNYNISICIFFRCFIVFFYILNLFLTTKILIYISKNTKYRVFDKYPHISYPLIGGSNILDYERNYKYSIFEYIYSIYIVSVPFYLFIKCLSIEIN